MGTFRDQVVAAARGPWNGTTWSAKSRNGQDSEEGGQSEDSRNHIWSGLQVPGDVGGLEGRRERGRGPGSWGYGGHPVRLAHWKRQFLRAVGRECSATSRKWSLGNGESTGG